MADTKYHFGWRPSRPDPRDAKHAFRAAPDTLAALPDEVDLSDDIRAKPWEPVWSQGEIGSCGPHSACADIVFSMVRQDGQQGVPMPSRLFTYWCTRKLMNTVESDSGVDNRSLLKSLNQFGWCDESLWPYDVNRFREQPPHEAFDQAATRKIVEYKAVPQVLEQMMGCLAEGDPFIFGFSVFQSMLTKSVEKSGDIPMPRLLDRPVGGHDILICGYRTSTRRFLFRNSWGSGWGSNGYGTIPMEYAVNPQLATDFWTVKHAAYVSPTPPAPPSPPSPPGPVGAGVIKFTADLDAKRIDLRFPSGWTGTATKE